MCHIISSLSMWPCAEDNLKFLTAQKGQVLEAEPKFTRVRFRIGCERKAKLKSNSARHNCAS